MLGNTDLFLEMSGFKKF